MNKLIAFALVGFGLTQVLVACSSDDSSSSDGTGGGGKGGSSSAGTGGKASGGSGGSSAQAGSTSGGKGGTGGSSSGGKGGSTSAGTGGTGGTPQGGSAPEGGMAGADVSGAGDTGAAGAPPVTPIPATKLWLAEFCIARSSDTKGCTGATTFDACYGEYEGFFDNMALCTNDDDSFTKLLALQTALDNLSTACPMPDTSQIRCSNADGSPQFIDANCRAADSARLTATMACMLMPVTP